MTKFWATSVHNFLDKYFLPVYVLLHYFKKRFFVKTTYHGDRQHNCRSRWGFFRISGNGIFFPDGGETQRRGTRINKIVKPSIEGIRTGKDELLEEAIRIIRSKTPTK